MEQHFDLSDIEFEQQFENCSLNPGLFSHEAHLRLAWIHITKYGVDTAIQNISSQLMQFTEFVGAKAKYNHTLTLAAIKAVRHFIDKSSSENFKDFIAEFPQLKFNFKALMKTHYKTDIFTLEKARLVYLEPDLLPFD